MSFDALMNLCDDLAQSVDSLAAIGAALRVRSEGLMPEPSIGQLLNDIVEQAQPGLLAGVDAAELTIAQSFISTRFRQSLDLLDNPARPAGWHYDDPAVLDSQGKASRTVVRKIETFAKRRPSLAAALQQPGTFLDIGTGAGWIAIEAALRWPGIRVTGIDKWEPSLALARKNVAESKVADRIAIHNRGLEDLGEIGGYNLIWLPGPFIPETVVRLALQSLFRALVPGGTLIFGLYAPPSKAMAELLQKLQVVRSGGHPWKREEVERLLAGNGFTNIEAFSIDEFLVLVAASRQATG